MNVEPKSLVRRLNPTCSKLLEVAVDRAASGRFYEIVIEHFLAAMFESPGTDISEIFAQLGKDPRKAQTEIETALQKMRTGNSGRPVFSENLFSWMEQSWLVASVNHGASLIRSGDLLAEYIRQPGRYSADSFSALESITIEELNKIFPSDIRAEAIESRPDPGESPRSTSAPGREALSKFTVSFTERAKKGEIDKIFGRDAEIRQMIDILSRRRKNNPIIVGEPGVGKTALVEGLALAILNGEVPSALGDTELLGLDLGLLQAGAGVKGELESRLKRVIAEIQGSPTPIILFIDEAHTIIGPGGRDSGDLANLLKPALARGELRTIAATTWAEFKKYFEKDAALERRFQPVKVEEPTITQAVIMLRGLRDTYENAHSVVLRDDAVLAAVELSDRYISGRQLPDKAVDLLDTAAARVKIEQSATPLEITNIRSDLAAIERKLAALDRDRNDGFPVDEEQAQESRQKLENLTNSLQELETRWADERSAIEELAQSQQALRELDPQDQKRVDQLEALKTKRSQLSDIQGESALIHAEVDRDAVARVVSDWTGIPVGKMQSDTIGGLLQLEDRLQARIRGQDDAMRIVSESIRMAHAGVRDPKTPIAVLLFVGPSGVGKTETVLTMADTLYGGESAVVTINMSEFQEKHSVSRLIGSPPGYVGYGEGGVLTEAVRQRPYSVVLLDECEKADLEVMNLFYQVFDKGNLSDGDGRIIDFRNTVVVLTSNLASEQIDKLCSHDQVPDHETIVEAIRPTLSRHFKPALLGRMTIVPYRPVKGDVLRQIAELKLKTIADRLRRAHRIETEFTPEVLEQLSQRCLETEAGARAIDQTLRSSLMPYLAKELLSQIADGQITSSLRVGISSGQGWTVEFK